MSVAILAAVGLAQNVSAPKSPDTTPTTTSPAPQNAGATVPTPARPAPPTATTVLPPDVPAAISKGQSFIDAQAQTALKPVSIPASVQNQLTVLSDLKAGSKPSDTRDPQSIYRGQALEGAKAKIKNNDLSGAESILTATNPFAPNTANWHLDTSHSLMDLADQMSREANKKNVSAVVTQVLQHLDTCGTLARQSGDAQSQAQAKAAAGFIYERYRGDTASAIASYQAALQLQPNDKALQETLERLQKTDANLKARLQSRKR
jgi:hypothetical protein